MHSIRFRSAPVTTDAEEPDFSIPCMTLISDADICRKRANSTRLPMSSMSGVS